MSAFDFFLFYVKDSSSNFNKLLLSLAIIDSLLIMFFVLENSVINNFVECEPIWYQVAFPHFFYPGKKIMLSCSIFMVVAISAERLVKVVI